MITTIWWSIIATSIMKIGLEVSQQHILGFTTS
jgi:hypothetical protein